MFNECMHPRMYGCIHCRFVGLCMCVLTRVGARIHTSHIIDMQTGTHTSHTRAHVTRIEVCRFVCSLVHACMHTQMHALLTCRHTPIQHRRDHPMHECMYPCKHAYIRSPGDHQNDGFDETQCECAFRDSNRKLQT